ncbi:MAG: insulinase family protein [Myxococcales bacterium]|nr:insulinase family protein [Myxococcales bacterium]
MNTARRSTHTIKPSLLLSLVALTTSGVFAACRGDTTDGAIQTQNNGAGSSGSTAVDAAAPSANAEQDAAVVAETQPTDEPAQARVVEPLPDAPARTTPDAEFRRRAPPPGRPSRFVAPRVQRFALANGLKVYLVEQQQFPIVVAQFVTRLGGDDVPPEQAGIAHMTASLLEQGTTTLGAEQLSDAYAAIGAQHGASMDWDSGGAYVKVLAPQFNRALQLLADVVQRPAFTTEEIERWRARRLAELRSERDNPRAVGGVVTARAVFGDAHPYGRPLTGLEGSIRTLTRDHVLQFYRSHFVPGESALVVAGAITAAQLRAAAEREFGGWRQEAPATPIATPRAAVPAAPSGPPKVWIVDRPRAPQSMVILAMPGAARSDPDFERIQVGNAILGEIFSSRINMNLRERNAFTYGARARFAFRRGAGPFSAGGAMHTRNTAQSVTEIINEVRRMRESDVTADELSTARTSIVEGFRAQFATAEGTADAISDLFVYNLPDNYVGQYPSAIERVTARDVRRVMTARLDPARLNVIVVGDRAAVTPGIDELRRGPIELRDPEGAPVNATSAASTTSAPTNASADAGAR